MRTGQCPKRGAQHIELNSTWSTLIPNPGYNKLQEHRKRVSELASGMLSMPSRLRREAGNMDCDTLLCKGGPQDLTPCDQEHQLHLFLV